MADSTLSSSDVEWLIATRDFNKNYDNWINDPLKKYISNQLYIRIDISFRTIRRAIDTRNFSPEGRLRVYRQIEALSFLTGMAEVELGKHPDQLFL